MFAERRQLAVIEQAGFAAGDFPAFENFGLQVRKATQILDLTASRLRFYRQRFVVPGVGHR
ncbi:hypothetical protein D9M71_833860 [compost metagenome]